MLQAFCAARAPRCVCGHAAGRLPLGREDGVKTLIQNDAVLPERLTQRPFEAGAELDERLAGPAVLDRDAGFDAVKAQRPERIPEQQPLRLNVHARSPALAP